MTELARSWHRPGDLATSWFSESQPYVAVAAQGPSESRSSRLRATCLSAGDLGLAEWSPTVEDARVLWRADE